MSNRPPRPAERLAYFDCFAGISGDMTLGALLDAGLDLQELAGALAALGLRDYELRAAPVRRQHLAGTQVTIAVTAAQPHRRYTDIVELITKAALPHPVQERSLAMLRRLGEAEARVHGQALEQVHFHEIGAVDSILDLVGAAYGLWALGITQVYASPLPWGRGVITCAHGVLPNPAPATALLLQGAPVYGTDIAGELVTPTGAAILTGAGARFGPCPAMSVESLGYGAGSRDFPSHPNLLRLFVGAAAAAGLGAAETVTVLETHIDDLPPELYDHLMERLFAAGALDVAYSPLQMKKNRPGLRLTVICPPPVRTLVLETLFAESTTLGVRVAEMARVTLPRWSETIDTPYGPLTVKATEINGRRRWLPEYDSCRELARRHHLPLLEVYRLVARHADAGEADGPQ